MAETASTMPDSRDALLDLKLATMTERSQIESQLSESIYNERERGIKPDWDWIRRAKYALGQKKVLLQRIDIALSRIREAEQGSLERHFITVAKERLSEYSFAQILEDAKRRSSSAKPPVAAEGLDSSNSAR